MMRSVLEKFNIDSFAYLPASLCRSANMRLFSALPSIEELNVVFMLFPYYCGDCRNAISRYAAVYDYHFFAKEVFLSLEEYTKSKYPGAFAKGFSDHSPFGECHGAAMAGLGVLGKNSLLINEKYSSFVFIGEFIVSLSPKELESEGIPAGQGFVRECPDCKLCARSCPAGCVGVKERENCISAITQKKGVLSEDEAKALVKGASIWGCDMCQDACPYTKSALEKGTIYTPIGFFRDSYLGENAVDSIKAMDDSVFSLYPFSWRKREVIERNIDIIGKGEKK